MKTDQRDIALDLLRFLGILIIIMAHCRPPGWLFQLRNFGAPLLVVVSAMTYAVIYARRDMEAARFLKRRILRLVVPAWLFLTILFSLIFVVTLFTQAAYPFSADEIAQSYFFLDGIGFVWIFRIYILLALITPFALSVGRSDLRDSHYFLLLFAAYVCYEILAELIGRGVANTGFAFAAKTLLVLIPYVFLYFYGMRAGRLSTKTLITISAISVAIFMTLCVFKFIDAGELVTTQEFKYPPTLYYLSYAFFAVNALIVASRYISIQNKTARSIVIWLSSNSLWIYLWHIMAFFIWRAFLDDYFTNELLAFVCNFVFIVAFGIIVTALQLELFKEIRRDGRLGRRVASLLV